VLFSVLRNVHHVVAHPDRVVDLLVGSARRKWIVHNENSSQNVFYSHNSFRRGRSSGPFRRWRLVWGQKLLRRTWVCIHVQILPS
jgi:hypothetical protein